LAESLTFSLHAHHQTLLIPAVLTPVPLTFVYYAISLFTTRVTQIFADGSFEESFAAFAAESGGETDGLERGSYDCVHLLSTNLYTP
jgi:hypothetical protein